MPLEDQLTAIGNALNRIATALESGAKPNVTVKTATVETTTVEVDAPKPKAAKAKPAAEPKAETPPPAAAPAAPDRPITVNDLRNAAQQLLQAGKVKDIVAINTRLGVRKISEAPPEKYAEIYAALQEVIATIPAPDATTQA